MIQQYFIIPFRRKKMCLSTLCYKINLKISQCIYVLTLNITHGLTENMFQQIDQKHRTQKYF